jgi:transcriptional regulator with XRE-family HTH domain
MRLKEKEEAIRIRKEFGLSINDIAKKLNVAKSSVSLWVRDIPLTEEQKNIFKENQKNAQHNFTHLYGNTFSRDKFKKIREEYQDAGKQKAREYNPLHIMGCMLYWGEGSKNKNSVRFTNSDSNALKLFIKFLTECYDVKLENIGLVINAHTNNGITIQEIEKYWLDILNLPQKCLKKSTINVYSKFSSQKKKGKLLYGTCRLEIHRTDIVQSIYGAIQEYGNFENKIWLY